MRRQRLLSIVGLFFSIPLFFSCAFDQGDPFQFGAGGAASPGGDERNINNACQSDADCAGAVCDLISGLCSVSLPPVTPKFGCGADADCPGGQVCDLGTFQCRAPKTTCPGVSCREDQSLDTATCRCINTCPVDFNATLVLKGDSPVEDKYDIPADCRLYGLDLNEPFDGPYPPTPQEHRDLYCCNNPDPDLSMSYPYGSRDCDETPSPAKKINTIRYFPDKPMKLKFDLSDPARCRVFLEARDFPTYRIANTAMDAALKIDAGQGEGDFEGLTAQGSCREEGGVIHIEEFEGLHFRIRFYDRLTDTSFPILDPEAPFTGGTIFPPQVVPPFEDDPGTPIQDQEGLSLTTGSVTVPPGTPPPVRFSDVGPKTTTGSPLQNGHLKLVTGVPLSNEASPPLGGKLSVALAGAALAADIEGEVTHPATDEPVMTLEGIKNNCEVLPSGPDLAIFAKHSWSAGETTTAGEEGISLAGNPSQGFSGTVTFRQSPFIRRTNEEAVNQAYANSEVRRRFESEETILITNEADHTPLALDPTITPADGAFQLAGEGTTPSLEVGGLLPLVLSFRPVEGAPGCTTEGVCQATLTLAANRLTLVLRATASVRSGRLSISEVQKGASYNDDSYGSNLGRVLSAPAPVNENSYFGLYPDETTLQGTCRSKVYRVSNTGVLNIGSVGLPIMEATGYFTRGQIRQGEVFRTAPPISGGSLPARSITPDGKTDIFFYLRFCPTTLPNLNPINSQYGVSSNAGSFSFNVEGKPEKKADAIPQIYISDFEAYSGADCTDSRSGIPKTADLVAPDGKCLYAVREVIDPVTSKISGEFSLRSNRVTRDVYVVNRKAKNGADRLRVNQIIFGGAHDQFSFTPGTALPFDVSHCPDAGNGGTRCPIGASCDETPTTGWCRKIGTITFGSDPAGPFGIVSHDFKLVTKTVRASGEADLPETEMAFKGANGAPSGFKTFHVGRLFAGFPNKLAGAVGIASSVTQAQVIGAQRSDIPGASLEEDVDRFSILVELRPEAGVILIPGVYTPVTESFTPPNYTRRSSEGISLFNAPGSSADRPNEYLYSFQCRSATCRYFSAFLADRGLVLKGSDSCRRSFYGQNTTPGEACYNDGSRGFYGLYAGDLSPVAGLNPKVESMANQLRSSLSQDDARIAGFFDPVTGELLFSNNIVVRLFSPEVPLLDATDADVTIELSLTTGCVDTELVPLYTGIPGSYFPLAVGQVPGRYDAGESSILNPRINSLIVNASEGSPGLSYYGPNPLPYYVAGAAGETTANPSSCRPGILHGRRMWGGSGHEENLDHTGTLDKDRSNPDSETNRFRNPNFDLAGVGVMRSNQATVHNRPIYLVIKGCLGESETGPDGTPRPVSPGADPDCQ